MRSLCYIALFFLCTLVKAQDKLYFNNGTVRQGIVVSIGKDAVYFKNSDTSVARPVKKTELLMVENYKGVRYLFSRETTDAPKETPASKQKYPNSVSFAPLALMMGRAAFSYERLSDDGRIGLAVPVALSFNPYPNLTSLDTISGVRKSGANVIAGIDVNFYMRSEPDDLAHFMIGPRIRYGTDVLFFDTEYFSIQTQIGWKFERPESRFVQHITFGYGFLQVLSTAGFNASKRKFACYSINYSLGIKW